MQAKYYHLNMDDAESCISSLKNEEWLSNWLKDFESWTHIIKNVRQGQIYESNELVFFEENFGEWAMRLLGER